MLRDNPLDSNPALALLNDIQLAIIRSGVRHVLSQWRAATFPSRTPSDIDLAPLRVSLRYHDFRRIGPGVDVDWTYELDGLHISGSTDIYGHGEAPVVQLLHPPTHPPAA